MRKTGVYVALCAALAGAQTAHGQEPAASPAAACELHVWPNAGLGSVYYGWLAAGINNGAIKGREGYPKVPANPLDTPVQVALLTDAQPQRVLGRPTDRLVVHPEALASRVARGTPGRIEPTAGPCYAELIVDGVMLRQDIVNGSFLQVLYRYRDFGMGTVPQRTFGTWVKTALSRTDGDPEAATREIRNAYKANLTLFARAQSVGPARQ